jgi:hypothetical protein
MCALLDQVAVKVARAERAFVRLRKNIAAAGEDLQTQQLWLDQNRASPLKGQHPLSNKRTIWAFARFAIGLPLLLPVGSVKGRTIISALAIIILVLITAGAVRVMPPLLCEVQLPLSPKVKALPATALTEPFKSTLPIPSVSGFSLIEEALVPKPQPLSAYSTLSMMLITSIMSPSPISAEASTTSLVVGEPPAAQPPLKAQTKRKLASQKPPELSWWQLPWIRVR